MFEEIPQELKQQASEALLAASGALWKTFYEAESIVEKVDIQIAEWREALNADEPVESVVTTEQEKYDYLLKHSNDFEKDMYGRGYVKNFLLSDKDTLETLYQSKVEENKSPFEDSAWFDWSKAAQNWLDKD